jgi:type IX secretion system PorP/SprF family membrane protein
MKNAILLFLGLGICASAHAQQDPYYSHFKYNIQAYNPGAIAKNPLTFCVNAVSHKQWFGFDDRTPLKRNPGMPEGEIVNSNVAPLTNNINVYGPLMLQGMWSSTWFAGASVVSDNINQFTGTSINLKIAKRFTVSRTGNISIGSNIGFEELALKNPNFIARQIPDPRIPIYVNGISDQHFDVGLGIYYQNRRFGSLLDNYLGLSVQHLPQSSFRLQSFDIDQKMHLYLSGGTRIQIRPYFVLEPAFLFKYSAIGQIDLNTSLLYDSKYRFGIGFRQWKTSDALSVSIGYVKRRLQVGYSYDITLSNIHLVSHGTHELMVSYCIPIETYWHRNTREL